MNIFDLLKKINMEDLKALSQETLNKLKELIVTGEAGGGFVKVTINGEFMILSIDYEENNIIKDDIAAFRDLIISAHNNAVSKMKEEIQSKISSSFIPGMF